MSETPARATQVEATAAQISVYISQARIEVERHQRDIDRYLLEVDRVQMFAHKSISDDQKSEQETHLRYLRWWKDAASQKEEGLRVALTRMQEAYAIGVPVDATVAGVLSVAVRQTAQLATLSAEPPVPEGQDDRVLAQLPSLSGSPRRIKELKGSIIDPQQLRRLRDGRNANRQDILLPARVISLLQQVVPHEARQAGLMERIQQIFFFDWAQTLPVEKKAVVRRFVRTLKAKSSPDIVQIDPSDARVMTVDPCDLDLLVSQILSPALDSQDVLEALSTLLRVVVEVLPKDIADKAPLLRHNVIATLFLRSAAPELAVGWLLHVPAPPAAERAGYNDTYRVLAATMAIDWPSFQGVTESLLGNQALSDINSLARVVFLQGLILRHETVPDFYAAFDWACSAFFAAGLATSDPKLALRVSAGYADAIGAHELKLRIESRLEIVEAEDRKRLRARARSRQGDQPESSTSIRSPLLSDSEVVQKFSVTLDPSLLRQIVGSTPGEAPDEPLPRIEPPRIEPHDVWTSVNTVFYTIGDVWRRVFEGRPRLPPPRPDLAPIGDIQPAPRPRPAGIRAPARAEHASRSTVADQLQVTAVKTVVVPTGQPSSPASRSPPKRSHPPSSPPELRLEKRPSSPTIAKRPGLPYKSEHRNSFSRDSASREISSSATPRPIGHETPP